MLMMNCPFKQKNKNKTKKNCCIIVKKNLKCTMYKHSICRLSPFTVTVSYYIVGQLTNAADEVKFNCFIKSCIVQYRRMKIS